MARILLYCMIALSLLPMRAYGFEYPCGAKGGSEIVRLVVPLGAGTANDAYARYLAEQLKRPEYLNRSVVVENMPGAYGSIAAKHVAAALPNGCTLLVGINSTFAVGPMFGQETVDFLKDLTPITGFVQSIQVFSVNPSLGVKTLDEFIEYVKTHPKLDIATSAGSARVAGELLVTALGTNDSTKTVPYRVEPEAIQAAVGGHTCCVMALDTTTRPQVESGKLIALAVVDTRHKRFWGGIPSLMERFPVFSVMGDIPASSAIFAPAGFEEAEQLSQVVRKILTEPSMVEFVRKHGGEPIPSTPSELKKDTASQLRSWERAVEAAGLTYKK